MIGNRSHLGAVELPCGPQLEPFEPGDADPTALEPVGLRYILSKRSWLWRCACRVAVVGPVRAAVVPLVAAHRMGCDRLPSPPAGRASCRS